MRIVVFVLLCTVPVLSKGTSQSRPKSTRSVKPKARAKSKRMNTRKAKHRRSARRMSDYRRRGSVRGKTTQRSERRESKGSRSSVKVRKNRTSFRSSQNRRRTWNGSTRRRASSIRSTGKPRPASLGSLRTMKAQNYDATRRQSVSSASSRVSRGEKALQRSKYAVGRVPLPSNVAKYRSAFTDGNVRISLTKQAQTLYRVHSPSTQKGGWLTSQRPTSSAQARKDFALKPEWNKCNRLSQVTVPKGTLVYTGRASPQGKNLPGGARQVLVDHGDRRSLKYGKAQVLK